MWRILVWVVVFYTVNFTGAIAGPNKSFKDWSVSCTDGLICSMTTYPEKRDIYTLGFERGTAAGAELVLSFAIDGDLKKNGSVNLKIPGQPADITLPNSDGKFVDHVWMFSLDGHMDELLRALKAGTHIQISVQSEKGDINEKLSLSGVAASMLFLDEAQGRVGRQDALQAKGDKPAIEVVTRVYELQLQSELPESVRVLWKKNYNECGDAEEDIIAKYGGIRVDLGEDSSLFVLPCGFPGAYNMPYIALSHDKDSGFARVISFPVIGPQGPTNMDMAYNINWDDKKSQLDAFFRGRGIGDCGSKHLWQWTDDGIFSQFELLEERMKDDCDEKFGEFPLLWPPD